MKKWVKRLKEKREIDEKYKHRNELAITNPQEKLSRK